MKKHKKREFKRYNGVPKHLRTQKTPKGMDYHHLIPYSVCHKTERNNLVLIKKVKHKAFHYSFGNRTIGEILNNFSSLANKVTKGNWEIMFGKKTVRQAYLLLDRLWSIKKQIKI